MPIETRVEARGGLLSQADADLFAVPVPAGAVAPDAEIAAFLPFTLDELLALHKAKGEPGEVIATPVRIGDRVRELLLYGVGAATPADLRRAGAALARRARGRASLAAGVPAGDLAAFVEGALLASYGFSIGKPPSRPAAPTIVVLTEAGPDAAADAIALGTVRARATALARDLANTPSGEKGPSWLAARATEIGAESGLTVRVRDEKELAAGGFGGLVAVGGGSARPPRLVELSYDPGDADRHVVLVGKGITFDTGGLSLKPGPAMTTMKTDMAGSAVVLGVLSALRDLGVRTRVTGLLAIAENMPSGSAMRPGDVITHFGGTTSEVLNTDAEGRLVLADALAYADAELDPDALIDVATLTGAAKVALGLKYGALFASDDALADALVAAGDTAGEPLWRLPLDEEYRPAIESDVADIANIGRPGFGAGATTAALFLREFTGGRTWAHLDVAGPGRSGSDDGEISKGATGYAVRLLLSYLAA
ncbi:Cytosol aminopeptidase [Actinomadura rubteroloni]|uniref:Probable cytosol aminopeptidase n=1 Tax=Actinomadura rubteroloni TaxID=1926885 RepID=A0A2P4UIM7_9ACTN|nr:leucyl aminopeptidase [Actinomadura rubteroloni]POM24886.1 Cytosol aminopeptidase [Actinomadura rubteroloni]